MATTAQRSNLEIVEGAYESFNSGDIEGVLAVFHDEIEWNEPPGAAYPGTYHGPQTVAEDVFGNIPGDYDGFQVTPHRFVDGGDTVVVLGQLTATVRETGTDVSVPFAHVCELADGKMVRFTDYTDTETIQQAHGN